ncbi:unnamed protein product, partial [Ectocarpus fasciculatus]
QARRGKRKLEYKMNATARLPERRQHDSAGSPTRNSSKRRRTTSAPTTSEQSRGTGSSAPSKTSKRKTARRSALGRRICREPGCTTQPTFGKKGSKTPEFCLKHRKQ